MKCSEKDRDGERKGGREEDEGSAVPDAHNTQRVGRRGDRGVGGRRCGIYVFNLTPYDQLSSPAEKSAG